jgi:TolA-binding protein
VSCTLARSVFGTALVLGLSLSGFARAADHFNEPLARASDKIGVVGERATRVLRAVAPGRAFPLRGEAAVQRYMDCMADEMLGEYDHAASGLFTLVTTGVLVEYGLHRDAEWSLAESLFGGGNDETAEIRLQAILDDPTHPFRPDAVRTLLELYAKEGRTEEFYALYKNEIASGKVRATDVITYSIGKSFFIQGTFSIGEAVKQFQSIPPTSQFYDRAQYFLGAIAVKSGDLAGAAPIFDAVSKLPVNTDDDRKVRDLATLALGRIYYERSEFAQAQEYYSQIAGDSPYLDRALYESAWNFIKQGKNAEALRAIDTYLLSFPAGDGAAELQVVQGQLHM